MVCANISVSKNVIFVVLAGTERVKVVAIEKNSKIRKSSFLNEMLVHHVQILICLLGKCKKA